MCTGSVLAPELYRRWRDCIELTRGGKCLLELRALMDATATRAQEIQRDMTTTPQSVERNAMHIACREAQGTRALTECAASVVCRVELDEFQSCISYSDDPSDAACRDTALRLVACVGTRAFTATLQ
jgi:hypothetical protein